MYTPDNWIVFKIKTNSGNEIYKILAVWSGEYLDRDSWRINSSIVSVEEDEHYYYFHGYSGSTYQCHKNAYCLRRNNSYIWKQIEERYKDRVEKMPEDTDWGKLFNE